MDTTKVKEYYWKDMVSGRVTKTLSSRKPSQMHKRITKAAWAQAELDALGAQLAANHAKLKQALAASAPAAEEG